MACTAMQGTPYFTQSQVHAALPHCQPTRSHRTRSDGRSLNTNASLIIASLLLADAILGALSQPDIGQLFPDSDPKWKGQTSDVFVREAVRDTVQTLLSRPHVSPSLHWCLCSAFCLDIASGLTHVWLLQVRLMHEHGYVLGNLDATIILQRPKLSPHKERIRENLCQLLGAHPSAINIKASANPISSSFYMHWCVCAYCISDINALISCQICNACSCAGKDT